MCAAKNGNNTCMGGILRRILCCRRLPTHPTDQNTETNSIVLCDTTIKLAPQEFTLSDDKIEAIVSAATAAAAATAPGVVARLMGLDSMPERSISRSRSLNSVEFGGESSDDHDKDAIQRRVKSTLSVREKPAFLELQDEKKFFVLSFDENKEEWAKWRKKITMSKKKKCEPGMIGEEKVEKTREKVVMENKEEEMIKQILLRVLKEEEEELSNRSSLESTQEAVNGGGGGMSIQDSPKSSPPLRNFYEKPYFEADYRNKRRRRKKKKKQQQQLLNGCSFKNIYESDGSSEESSPVSVLDFGQFLIDPSDKGLPSSLGEPNSRRNLSPKLEKYSQLSPIRETPSIKSDKNSDKVVEEKGEQKQQVCLISTKKFCQTQNCLSLLDEVCIIADTDVFNESNWIEKKLEKDSEHFQDIGAKLGFLILDELLLEELVDQLDITSPCEV